MRLAGLIAALALLGPAAAAAADQTGIAAGPAPVAHALAPNEILLEVDAVGTVRNRPDTIRLHVAVKGRGETAAAARAANAALVERVKAAARSAGVAAADIRPGAGPWARLGFIGNETADLAMPGVARTEGKTETATLEIRIRDSARLEAVRKAAEEAGADQVVGPLYTLENDEAARRSAKEDAIRRARAEADDYARALGLRVARILRVSERSQQFGNTEDMERMFATMYGLAGTPPDEIETTVRIAIDFALAPAR